MVVFDNRMRIISLTLLTIATATTSFIAGLNMKQIIAVSLFSFKTYATILFWRYRLGFAFFAIATLLGLGVIDITHIIEFASFDVILFLISMMTVIGFLEEEGFFERLINRIINLIGFQAERLILVMMLAAALFAALVDEVTSILFMTAMMLQITGKRKINPAPFVMMLVFATNIGSSATVIGNPVGVLIAFKGGLSFTDFLRWATPISIIALIITIFISTRIFAKDIQELNKALSLVPTEILEEEKESIFPSKIHSMEGYLDRSEEKDLHLKHEMSSWILFIGTILLLALHHPLEELLHLERNTLLLGTAMASAAAALLIDLERGREIIEKRVDWRTLIFFTLLFASVGTLQYVGVTERLAEGFLSLSGGSEVGLLISFTPIAAVLSAFLDNVLVVAMFAPIIQSLGGEGVYTFPLWWAVLFAGTFFGNLTLIGSTANIVAAGMLERERRVGINFLEWMKKGALVSIPTLALAIVLIYLQIPIMPR
jgi:Na+/H+ antiporter NhaD/arsenite permease-like protein